MDLSAAFDTVDCNVMLHRLSHDVGMGQTALKWFKSYLSDIIQAVHNNGSTSPARPLTCGVPRLRFGIWSAVVFYLCSTSIENHSEQQLAIALLC